MKLVVLGAGAWGTALANQAAGRHEVVLWARDEAQANAMSTQRINERYLPGLPLHPALRVTAAQDACWDAELIVIATPMLALRSVLGSIPQPSKLVWLCKGFEAGSGLLGHELAAQIKPNVPCCVLSGPSFAQEVARAQPTALVAASADATLRETVAAAFHSDALRVYTSDDPIGVEVGGAVKNVLAMAAGLCDGLAQAHGELVMVPGLNARAALLTRGLAEMTRLGVAMGARAETFMGLSGLGDLVLTATGGLSRNRRVGLGLAHGQTLAQVLQSLGHVAEGVSTAPVVLQRAQSLGVEMPITAVVVAVLEGRLSPSQGVHVLMSRDPRAEAI